MFKTFIPFAAISARACSVLVAGLVAVLCSAGVAGAEIREGVQFTGPEQTGQMGVDLAGSLAATEAITGIIGIDSIPEQELIIEVTDGPVQTALSPATAATDCNQQPSVGATIETGDLGELVDVRNLVVELFSQNSITLGLEPLELRICLTERCGGVGEIKISVDAEADVDSILFCQAGSAVVTPTATPGAYQVEIAGTAVVTGVWSAPLRVAGVPIPLTDDYVFDVPITLEGTARVTGRGLALDLSSLANPSIAVEYDVAAQLEDQPPLIVDADGYLVANAEAALALAVHLQSFSEVVTPPDEGFPFDVTSFSSIELLTQDRVSFNADFDAPIPDREDEVVVILDGQEIFRDEFRRFRKELFGDNVYTNNSLLGLDVTLDFDEQELRVRGTTRPKLQADLSDGLTVRLELGSDFGADTVEINVLLGLFWTLAECSLPGVPDGSSCQGGTGTCEAGFCKPIGLCANVSCDDSNDCTADVCDPGTGQCRFLERRDGFSCNGGDGVCQQGSCVPVDACTGLSCSDGNECTEDLCTDGSCSNTPQDGTICSDGICQDGQCVDLCASGCDDGEFCTFDLCDSTQGQCYNPPKVDRLPCDAGGHPGVCIDGACDQLAGCCDDGNECTDAVCLPGGACDNPPLDGKACTDAAGNPGVCQAGTCEPAPDPCEGDPCNDGNDCTIDFCDSTDGACSYLTQPVNAPCDADGHPGACDGEGTCDQLSGCCEDGNECTSNLCLPGGACDNPPLDGQSCNGGAGICQAGVCEPIDLCANVDCEDFNECTDNFCDSTTGQCSFPPVAEPAACTAPGGFPGECVSGICAPIVMDDGFEVTSFRLVRLGALDWTSFRADFDAEIPDNSDEVIISLDGQVIFSESFRSFRRALGDDTWTNSSLFGVSVTLDFANGEMRVRGRIRPALNANLDDGLTVELSFSNGYLGTDTIEVDTFLTLWSLAECSQPGAVNGDSCDRGRGICSAGFCVAQ